MTLSLIMLVTMGLSLPLSQAFHSLSLIFVGFLLCLYLSICFYLSLFIILAPSSPLFLNLALSSRLFLLLYCSFTFFQFHYVHRKNVIIQFICDLNEDTKVSKFQFIFKKNMYTMIEKANARIYVDKKEISVCISAINLS